MCTPLGLVYIVLESQTQDRHFKVIEPVQRRSMSQILGIWVGFFFKCQFLQLFILVIICEDEFVLCGRMDLG